MIETTQLVAYVVALGIAVAIPGPGMTALVARTANGGSKAGVAMLSGFICGDIIYLSFAVFGLVLVAKSFAPIFVLIKWCSVLYLCYLAWSFWRAEHHDLARGDLTSKDLFSTAVSGLMLTLGNPKPIAFYLALLPVVIDLENINFETYLSVLVPLTIMILASVGAIFILAAVSLRRALNRAAAQKSLHRGAAIAMAGAAGSIIIRDF